MVFSPLHWVPSALAALLTLSLVVNVYGKPHKTLGAATLLLALLGLVGYISAGGFRFFPIDFHTFHVWVGLATLTLSILLFVDKIILHRLESSKHCHVGKLAALMAAITLIMRAHDVYWPDAYGDFSSFGIEQQHPGGNIRSSSRGGSSRVPRHKAHANEQPTEQCH